MKPFSQTFRVRWADMDPNGHMRHSAYNDYAAQVRLAYFYECGIDFQFLEKNRCGPVLFREDTRFLKEVRLNEVVTVDLWLAALSRDGGRWKMVHFMEKESGLPAARITVEGAWIDLVTRKLITPPAQILAMVGGIAKTEDFQEVVAK